MQNNYNNILQCVDILSVAFAVGLAMEDAPRNSNNSEGGESSESGEEAAEEGQVEGEDAQDETEEEDEKKTIKQEEEEKGRRKLEEEYTEKIALKTAPAARPNSPPTPHPERCDNIFVTTLGITEWKASAGDSEGKENDHDNEQMKEVTKQIVHEKVRTGSRNLMRGKVVDGEKEREKDKVDQKNPTGDRSWYEDDDTGEVGMGDEGITEAEFVRHVQDSLAQAPILARCDKTGLHSNSGRELETAAAIRDAKQAYAALRSPRSGKRGLQSNTRRELVGAASAEAPLTDIDHGPNAQETPELQAPKSGRSGLHSDTNRELVAAGMAKENDIEFHGPFAHVQSAPPQPASLGNKIHSNTERVLEAGSSAGPLLPAKSTTGLHSNTEREREAAGSADPLFPGKSGLHSNTERELESEGGARKQFRRISQRTGVVATLHIAPAHYFSTASRPEEGERPQHKQERRLPQRELVGSSNAESASSYPTSSKDADRPSGPGAQRREKRLSQREFIGGGYAKKANSFPGSSTDTDQPSPGRQTRKLSQNDLLGLAYAALRDIAATSGAGPSNAPQAPSLYYEAKAPCPGSSSASLGQRDPPANEVSSSTDGLHFPDQPDTKTQMDLESSTDIRTVLEDFGSQYPSRGYISDSGQHRYAAQRDLNNSHRYHPYEQAMASTGETLNDAEEEVGDGLGSPTAHSGSPPSSETPSGFFARLRSAPDPDPNPDPDDDGGGEGMPESMPEDDTDNYPPPPRPEEDEINIRQPIQVDDIDSYYPPPPPPDEDTYSGPERIPDVHNYLQNYISGSYSTVPPSMLPWPWNPPNGDYFAPSQQHTSRFSSIQAPYLRVRHQGDRMLGRRPRCGLHIVTGMRRDKSLPADRRKGNRTPRSLGRVDVHFSPRDGDVILRHVRLPGQGAVEIWYPSIQTEDGDSLVRFKLDPFSYDSGTRESSNLLIVEAKGYISFEKMWIYMGSASHSILKAEQRVLGVGARDGRTIYAT